MEKKLTEQRYPWLSKHFGRCFGQVRSTELQWVSIQNSVFRNNTIMFSIMAEEKVLVLVMVVLSLPSWGNLGSPFTCSWARQGMREGVW